MQNKRLKLKQIRNQYFKDEKDRQRNLNPLYWNDNGRIGFLTAIITKG